MRWMLVFAIIAVVLCSSSQAVLRDEYERNRYEILDILDHGRNDMGGILDQFLMMENKLSQFQSGATITSEMYMMLGNELDYRVEHLGVLANAQWVGKYIFGGWDGSSVAYNTELTDELITGFQYVGSSEDYYVPISDEGDSLPYYLRGDILFGMDEGTVFDSIIDARDILLTGDSELISGFADEMIGSLVESQNKIGEGLVMISDRIDYAMSVPEPCSVLLFGFGFVLLQRRSR